MSPAFLDPVLPAVHTRREFLRAAGALALLGMSEHGEAQVRAITIAAVGDCMIARQISMLDSPALLKLIDVLRSADVTLGNFEMTLPPSDAAPSFHEGCAYVHLGVSGPDNRFIVNELKWAGFKMLGLANNHSLDYGVSGMLATIEKFDQGRILHAGTGRSLAEARAPAYLDTAFGRVALVSCASTFPDWTQAADGNGEIPGRAGLNPLHINLRLHVTPEQLHSLESIAKALGLPQAPAGQREFRFLSRTFVAASEPAVEASPEAGDQHEIQASIHRASRNADFVLMSIHAHEGGPAPEIPSPFLRPFAHACIDSGADVFVGHGPHVLRGIEVYRGRPIYYSLGNFIFHGESEKQIPAEIYKECGLQSTDPSDVFDKVLAGFSAPAFWQTVVPIATFEGKKLKELKLYPVTLRADLSRARRGTPELAEGEAAEGIIANLARLSEGYGTNVRFDGCVGIVQL